MQRPEPRPRIVLADLRGSVPPCRLWLGGHQWANWAQEKAVKHPIKHIKHSRTQPGWKNIVLVLNYYIHWYQTVKRVNTPEHRRKVLPYAVCFSYKYIVPAVAGEPMAAVVAGKRCWLTGCWQFSVTIFGSESLGFLVGLADAAEQVRTAMSETILFSHEKYPVQIKVFLRSQ